jgi:hypothetical protein
VEDRIGHRRVERAAEHATTFYPTTDPLVWTWNIAA